MPRRKTSRLRWLREVIHRSLAAAIDSVIFFFRISRGDFRGLDRAPRFSKRAFSLVRRRDDAPLDADSLPSAEGVWASAQQTFQARGVWPISFSYPRQVMTSSGAVAGGLCPLYPGHRYSFHDEQTYLQNYGKYDFALTHKKAGWDCFRHLEICHAGSIPYMPDAALIPPHTMVHYPKDFFARVADHLRANVPVVDDAVKEELKEYFNRTLTSRAMAEYLARVNPFLAEGQILYVDESAVGMPDYQSILTLIGLKQVFGNRVSVAYPIDYVYSDWMGDGAALYGRGFGYTRILDAAVRNDNEASGLKLELSRESLKDYGSVVVGSVTRNAEISQQLLVIHPPEKTLWIHGEDYGPTPKDIAAYKRAGVTVFARELS